MVVELVLNCSADWKGISSLVSVLLHTYSIIYSDGMYISLGRVEVACPAQLCWRCHLYRASENSDTPNPFTGGTSTSLKKRSASPTMPKKMVVASSSHPRNKWWRPQLT